MSLRTSASDSGLYRWAADEELKTSNFLRNMPFCDASHPPTAPSDACFTFRRAEKLIKLIIRSSIRNIKSEHLVMVVVGEND